MANNTIEVALNAVNGGKEYTILLGKSYIYPYKDGQRTSEIPIATKFTVGLQGNRFSQLSIKIDGSTDPLPNITDEEIGEACTKLKLIPVKFEDCNVKLYNLQGKMMMTATASSVTLATNTK